jgi:hypothetical protein
MLEIATRVDSFQVPERKLTSKNPLGHLMKIDMVYWTEKFGGDGLTELFMSPHPS